MVARKWKSCNLIDMKHEILKYCFLIPSLPPDQFGNAINEITALIEDKSYDCKELLRDLSSFINFLKRWWIPLAKIISFSNDTDGSINISEYFDRHIGSELGSLTPNIFQFSGIE